MAKKDNKNSSLRTSCITNQHQPAPTTTNHHQPPPTITNHHLSLGQIFIAGSVSSQEVYTVPMISMSWTPSWWSWRPPSTTTTDPCALHRWDVGSCPPLKWWFVSKKTGRCFFFCWDMLWKNDWWNLFCCYAVWCGNWVWDQPSLILTPGNCTKKQPAWTWQWRFIIRHYTYMCM